MLIPAAASGTLSALGRGGDCWGGGHFRDRSHWCGRGIQPRPVSKQAKAISGTDRKSGSIERHTHTHTALYAFAQVRSIDIKSDLHTALHPIILSHTQTPEGNSTILDLTLFSYSLLNKKGSQVKK